MAEYTTAIDASISQLLAQRGEVTPEMLAGLTHDEASAFLARYVEVHAHEVEFVFDGQRLTWATRANAAPVAPTLAPPPTAGYASPVDQVLAAPTGGALLDVERSEKPVGGGMWLLPILFGFLGGLVAWLIVRGESPRTGRNLLIGGVVVSVLSALLPLLFLPGLMVGGLGSSGGSASWPPSTTGQPTFYYFGTAT